MKRRLFLAAALAVLAAPAMAQKIPLGELATYINGITSAKSGFTQINDDGSITTGEIFIKRPGRARFDYAAPDNSLVIAGGGQVAIFDPKSNVPPEQFPVTVQDPKNPEYGNIQLKFTGNPIQLRQWVITNDAGQQTTVIMQALEPTSSIPSRFFNIPQEIEARGLN